MIIRRELPEDVSGVRRVEEVAFNRTGEAKLVDALRNRSVVTLSLVAVEAEQVIGHILFSPTNVITGSAHLPCEGVGPLAVLPEFQKQGVGAELMNSGLELVFSGGAKAVFVLGNPAYYGRFGFIRADHFGIHCEFDVPPQAFMVKEAEHGILNGWSGVMFYQPEFRDV
jgi:putative acetyltransferase